jgi:predicted nucleic-acid-binding protein
VQSIKGSTGFTPTEIFRKYLWFLLRERKFDQEAVDDVVALKVSRWPLT